MAGSDNTMLAAVVERFGEPYVIKRVPRPSSPQGQDLLVKVLAASYCHTDAVFAAGGMAQELPRVGCHEFAGEIVQLGPDVAPDSGLSVGVAVGVPGRPYHACGACYECTHSSDTPGYSPYCPRAGNLGLTRDGGFQEYCLVDSRQVAPVPATAEDGQGRRPLLPATQVAPLMCAGLTIWGALHHEKVRSAKKIAIIGAGGGLGHLGVQFAALLGKEVLAVDASDSALALLQRVRARLLDGGSEATAAAGERVHVADARRDSVQAMRALVQEGDNNVDGGLGGTEKPAGERGLDAAILLPESQAAFDTGMGLLRNHGAMVVVSFPQKKFEVSASDLVFRDIALVGSLVGSNRQLREMLQFCTTHGVSAQVRTFPLQQLNNLVEESHHGSGGKLVVDMTLN